MRNKYKRQIAMALTVLLINLTILMYKNFLNTTPGDILRRPVIMEQLGPALPPDDLEEKVTQQRFILFTPPRNRTELQVHTSKELKQIKVADKFLIYSYLKSGASRLAETLNLHHREIFYLHHPLKSLDQHEPYSGLNILNTKLGKEGLEMLKSIYNCSFQEPERFLKEAILWKSNSMHNTYSEQCKNSPIIDCMKNACEQRQLRAIYTLRLGTKYIYELVKLYGDKLKVIVMLRDPRAILANRRRDNVVQHLNNPKEFQQHASQLCAIMAADVQFAQLINKKFPGSILVLRYEHLVSQPAAVVTYLYEFLGLEVSTKRFLDILGILRLDIPEEQRLQQTKTWELELTLQESRAVDKGCNYHYKSLGYFPVPKNINAYNKYFISWLPPGKSQ